MKKTLVFMILIIITFLTGCTKNRIYYYNYDEMKEKTIRIDIVEMFGHSNRKYNEYIETLDDELIDEFLKDLSKIEFTKPWGISNPRFPLGIAFLVCYTDGTFDVINISSTYGDILELGCTVEDYNKLVKKYYK